MSRILHNITEIITKDFTSDFVNRKALIVFPWERDRERLYADIITPTGWRAVHYVLTIDDDTLTSFAARLQQFLANEHNIGGQFGDALGSDANTLASALANDLNASAANDPMFFYLDQCDYLNVDDALVEFIQTLTAQVSEHVRLVYATRFMIYNPWRNIIEGSNAIAFNKDYHANDGSYVLTTQPVPPLEVNAFGRGHTYADGNLISNWEGGLPKHLFYYFVDHPLATRDAIFKSFWPKLPKKDATNVFHVTKRKITERISREVNTEGDYELTQYISGYYKPSGRLSMFYDVEEFVNYVNRAEAAKSEDEELTYLEFAVDLYKGDFLQGTKMEWALERQAELREMFVNALVNLARLYVRRNKPVVALGYFIRALKSYPLREDVQRDVIELYLNQGMVSDAKRQYRNLEELLRKEQDIAPSPETRELYERVLRAE